MLQNSLSLVLNLFFMANDKIDKAKKYKIHIDQRPFEVESRIITGSQLKQLAGVSQTYGVWLKTSGAEPDIEVGDQEAIDLDQPGREHFFTGSKGTTEGYVLA
jgi:hypothetical protein